jgi:hypothetical protein
MERMKINSNDINMLRTLCLSEREFGGQMKPTLNSKNKCEWVVTDKLIYGTKIEDVSGDEAKNYSGGVQKTVQIASTPFYGEIWHKEKVCNDDCYANMFFHCHPLTIYQLAPPSIGDFAAHACLGQLKNYSENKLLNTMFVVSFEGIYEYGIEKWRFNELLNKYGTLITNTMAKKLRSDVFDELRESQEEFYTEAEKLISRGGFGLKNAPLIDSKKWLCNRGKNTCGNLNFNFEYAKSLRDPKFINALERFHKNNSFAKRLRKCGFYYTFHPYNNDYYFHVSVNCS